MTCRLELWGGHECTVNRVGHAYSDQTRLTGHEDRIGDLDLFAGLGCRALRYPVLWERVSPDDPNIRDWTWSDARLARLRDLKVRPIVGLVHHGSGPAYTDLFDPGFAEGMAEHARAVAERYPWVEDWTPVNEPLTTARFSALYGHWYPHATDESAFWRAFLNQIDAVRLAMSAIRKSIPTARLIQTEDLGRTYGVSALADQVAFDNHRRWLSWDLLVGRVDEDHPMFSRMAMFGLGDRLKAIVQDPCPPNVIGVNHYLTSDRFLDNRIERYPLHTHGGNGRDHYADVEAVRVLTPGPDGLEGVLRETHKRYGLPIAVTEIHNGCTREEQMRWLLEAWRTAERLQQEGVDLRAVTAWSLLGSFGWDELLRKPGGRYEPGVFDLSGGAPRPTGVAGLMRALSAGEPTPIAAEGAGWWRRDARLEYQPADRADVGDPPQGPACAWKPERPILITGDATVHAEAFVEVCRRRGMACVRLAATRPGANFAIGDGPLWAVIHAGASRNAALRWARKCAAGNLALVVVSGARPPRTELGLARVNAEDDRFERRLLAQCDRALMVRVAVPLAQMPPSQALALAREALDLLADGESGVWRADDRSAGLAGLVKVAYAPSEETAFAAE